MTDITIYTSANNNEEILVLPIVPKELPEVIQEYCHEDFESNTKSLTLIGRGKARTLTLSFLLPVNKNYNKINKKADNNGWAYIEFWQKWSERKVPMRLIITEGAKELLNIAYVIKSLNYKVDKKKDIIATLEIKEYIFTREVQQEEAEYKWENINIKYNGASMSVTAANVDGHWLIPCRQALELLGYNVIWNAAEKSIYMTKDGISYKLNTPFEIYDGVSYAYIYKICKELGYTSQWDGSSRTVDIAQEWKWENITLKLGGNEYEVRAAMVNDRWIVPVRRLLEFLGYTIEWNAEEKAIYYKKDNDSIWYKLITQYWLYDDVSYCYLYRACEETGFNAQWDRESKTVIFTQS